MRSLRFRRAARRDIVDIARYVADRAQSAEAGKRVRDALLHECTRLAGLQAIMGRPRGELRAGLRSVPFRPYIVFFSYPDADTLEIARVLHGARDLTVIFADDAD